MIQLNPKKKTSSLPMALWTTSLPSAVSQKACFPIFHHGSDFMTLLRGPNTKRGLRSMTPTVMTNGSHKHLPYCLEGCVSNWQGQQLEVRDGLFIFISLVTSKVLEHSRLSKKFTEWLVEVRIILLANLQMPKEYSAQTSNVWFHCWQLSRALPSPLGCPVSWLTFRPFLDTIHILLGILLDQEPPFSELKHI